MQLKRPESVTYFEPPKINDELQGGDFQQILSFMTAFTGTWMRSKLSLWISFFLFLSSFANLRNKSGNYMQLIVNFSIIVMGFLTLYIWNPPNFNQQPIQERTQ